MEKQYFETQRHIFQALLDGKKICCKEPIAGFKYLEMIHGNIVDDNAVISRWHFNEPEVWCLYEEFKKKQTYYRRKWISFGTNGIIIPNIWYNSKELADSRWPIVLPEATNGDWEEMEIDI